MSIKDISIYRTLDSEGKESVSLSWDPDTANCAGVKGFNVYRSVSSEGDFEKVNTSLITSGLGYYLDRDSPMKLGLTYYYKITCVGNDDEESSLDEADINYIFSEEDKFTNAFTAVSYAQIGRIQQTLVMQGQDGSFLFRIRYGPRCSQCWDDISKQSKTRNCPVCWGTGYMYGYVKLDKKIIFKRDSHMFDNTEIGFKEGSNLTAYVDNFPIVHPGDIVIDSRNNRFIVDKMYPTMIRNTILQQRLSVSFVNRDNPIYNIEGVERIIT